jgi:hypothetical protein
LSDELPKLIKIVQEKQENRKKDDLLLLQEYGIDYAIRWDGQYQLQSDYYWILYNPYTGAWFDRGPNVFDYGASTLIDYVRSFD